MPGWVVGGLVKVGGLCWLVMVGWLKLVNLDDWLRLVKVDYGWLRLIKVGQDWLVMLVNIGKLMGELAEGPWLPKRPHDLVCFFGSLGCFDSWVCNSACSAIIIHHEP